MKVEYIKNVNADTTEWSAGDEFSLIREKNTFLRMQFAKLNPHARKLEIIANTLSTIHILVYLTYGCFMLMVLYNIRWRN